MMRNLSETPWKTLSTKSVYRNKWIAVREDLVAMPDGRSTIYGVVTCGQCVGVLPFVDPHTVLLIKQYRYVARRLTWEMPTGGRRRTEGLGSSYPRTALQTRGMQHRNDGHAVDDFTA